MKNIKTEIRDGQKYFDEPVYAKPKRDVSSLIAQSVSAALNGGVPNTPRPIQTGHERIRLRWMRPDSKGNLVPRK